MDPTLDGHAARRDLVSGLRSDIIEFDPIEVEFRSTRAKQAQVLVARTRRQWSCADPGCPQDLFDEETEGVNRFIARIAPRRRSKDLLLLGPRCGRTLASSGQSGLPA